MVKDTGVEMQYFVPQSRLVVYIKKKKKGGGKVSKSQQYDPTNGLRDFFKPSGINPHWE